MTGNRGVRRKAGFGQRPGAMSVWSALRSAKSVRWADGEQVSWQGLRKVKDRGDVVPWEPGDRTDSSQ